MQRIAPEGEFRSNVHRGGRTEQIILNQEEEKIAVEAASVLGLRIAGVDLMRSKRGPLVLEVNSSPGLEGIEASSGVDVAGNIVRFIESDYED